MGKIKLIQLIKDHKLNIKSLGQKIENKYLQYANDGLHGLDSDSFINVYPNLVRYWIHPHHKTGKCVRPRGKAPLRALESIFGIKEIITIDDGYIFYKK